MQRNLFTKKPLKGLNIFLYAVIIVMCFIGAFLSTNTMFNIGMMLALALFGIMLDYFEIPVSPLLLAYILGPQLESYFRKGISYSDQGILAFFTRPVSCIFLIVAVASVAVPAIREARKKRAEKE